MDKAIIELQKYKNILLNEAAIGGYISDTKSIDEALAELQALESYIEEQIVECQKVIDTKKADMFTYYEADGLRQAYTDILQKIRGEKC